MRNYNVKYKLQPKVNLKISKYINQIILIKKIIMCISALRAQLEIKIFN